MVLPIVAMTAISAGASLLGSRASANAAGDAADAQVAASQAGIAEQQRQFNAIQQNLSPYISAGNAGLSGQLALLGLGDPTLSQQPTASGFFGSQKGKMTAEQAAAIPSAADQQAAAYSQIENSPGFQALVRQGENAILQNASATGGLRGGNTQAALAQFRPAMLQQAIDTQYQRLGGLAASGQNSAALTGQAGQQSAAGISNLLQQQGAATAGSALAGATAFNQGLAGVSNAAGNLLSTPSVQQSLFGGVPSFGTSPSYTGLY